MTLLLARHKVRDARAFVEGYQAPQQKSIRESAGVLKDEVMNTLEDANDVLVLHYFESVEQAEAFLANPDLAAAMENLGVIEAPKLQIFNPLA